MHPSYSRSVIIPEAIEAPSPMDWNIECPWNGYCHTIHITFASVPTSPGLIEIIKNARDRDGNTWDVEVTNIDPVECGETDIWFMTQFALDTREKVQIVYDNDDGIEMHTKVVLVAW